MPYYSPENLTKTKIKGIIVDEYNKPYSGALIEFQLNKPMNIGTTYVNNTVITVESNKFGRFEIDLLSSDLDTTQQNFYKVKIYYDRVTTSLVKVPNSSNVVLFSELLSLFKYVKPTTIFVDGTIGSTCNTGSTNSNTQTSQQYSTTPKWFFVDVDLNNVSQSIFSVGGKIGIVVLNGVVLAETQDFNLNSATSISLIVPGVTLQVGDRLGIQYYPI